MSSSFELNIKNNTIFDDFLNEQPEPISKKKQKTYKELKKYAMNCIHKRYGAKGKLKYTFYGQIMESLIFNKNTHLVSTFKDYMIWDYVEEFLKRYYRNKESEERVPKFATFYKNYLKFFCIPTFKDIYSNEMIHNYSEKKAELFYNENYRSAKEKNSVQEDYGVLEESESDDDDSDNKSSNLNFNIEKTIFNETVKKKIEKYSPINTSMVLPESETKLKSDDSGLLVTSSNESSLVNIMKGMVAPPPPPPQTKTKNNEAKNEKKKNNIKKNNNNQNNNTNDNNNNNNNNNKGESSSSYRMTQKNLMSSTLNKFSKTIETLLNSHMRNRNLFHYSDYTKMVQKNNRVSSKDNTNANSNNCIIRNRIGNSHKPINKNKIMSYIGIYKKKTIPKSRSENKSPEEIIKSQTQINNHINGSTKSNYNINNLKNNINMNQLGYNNNLSCRAKNMTSINNYNLYYKQSIQKSRNMHQSTSINSNTYSRYSFDKVNIKKKININLIKNSNIEYFLNQLKIHPFCTLKKNSTKRIIHPNSKSNNKKKDKKSSKKSNILSTNITTNNNYNQGNSDYDKISTKNRDLKGNFNNNQERPNSYKHKFQNSSSAFEFLKKKSHYIKNMKTKSTHSKDNKVTKNSGRNFSYNERHKSYGEEKKNTHNNFKNKHMINNKFNFDGIFNNSIKGIGNANQRKIKSINNNGTKHIHNVNININNQINIQSKQFHEIFAFSDLIKKNTKKKNNIKNIFNLAKNSKKNNYVSRNKNQSLDFNAYSNNPTNNANSIGSNKMNSISDIQNGNTNNIYKTQYKVKLGANVTNLYKNKNNNNNNNNNKKIKLTNNALFRSMKTINNNNNDINKGRNKV